MAEAFPVYSTVQSEYKRWHTPIGHADNETDAMDILRTYFAAGTDGLPLSRVELTNHPADGWGYWPIYHASSSDFVEED
jgi:hypothetical protein